MGGEGRDVRPLQPQRVAARPHPGVEALKVFGLQLQRARDRPRCRRDLLQDGLEAVLHVASRRLDGRLLVLPGHHVRGRAPLRDRLQ
eukprot:6947169-Prymnesium_polylepis.2